MGRPAVPAIYIFRDEWTDNRFFSIRPEGEDAPRSLRGRAQEVSNEMATDTRTSTGFASSWRELARMPTYRVPIVLGGFLAALLGVLTYAFEIVKASAIVALTAEMVYLILFGVFGLIGYSVSKHSVQNGSLVAAIAGLALVAIAGGTIGLLTGFLLLAGAVWGLATSR